MLSTLALAEAHLRTQTRMSKPKDQEYDFAKRTHISHVKSVVCDFRGQRKQGRTGAKDGAEPDQGTHNTRISVTEMKVVA